MMTGVRNLLWLIPLILLAGWPAYGPVLSRFLAPRGDFGENVRPGKATKRFVMTDVVYLQEMNGSPDWRITTRRLATGKGEDLLEMEAVSAVLFRNDQEHLRVSSVTGLYDRTNEILTLQDNVDLTTSDGYLIHTALLTYQEGEKKITTPAPLRITGRNMDIHASGLDYNLATGAFSLGGRVKFSTW